MKFLRLGLRRLSEIQMAARDARAPDWIATYGPISLRARSGWLCSLEFCEDPPYFPLPLWDGLTTCRVMLLRSSG